MRFKPFSLCFFFSCNVMVWLKCGLDSKHLCFADCLALACSSALPSLASLREVQLWPLLSHRVCCRTIFNTVPAWAWTVWKTWAIWAELSFGVGFSLRFSWCCRCTQPNDGCYDPAFDKLLGFVLSACNIFNYVMVDMYVKKITYFNWLFFSF